MRDRGEGRQPEGSGCRRAEVFIEPGEPAVEAVPLVGGEADAVELAGIDDQFGGYAEGAEGLVHLFAAGGWDVEVFVAAHKKGWRFDAVCFQEGIADLQIAVDAGPGGSDLIIILIDILVDAIEREGKPGTGAAAGCLEPGIGGDEVVGEDAAITPAGDAEVVGVGQSFLDEVVYRAMQVDYFLISPIGGYRFTEIDPAAATAAIIHGGYQVAGSGEDLPGQIKIECVLANRAAVDKEDEGQLLAFRSVSGAVIDAGNRSFRRGSGGEGTTFASTSVAKNSSV